MTRGSPRTPSNRERKKPRQVKAIDPKSTQGQAIAKKLLDGLPPAEAPKKQRQ